MDYEELLKRLAPCGLDCMRCADYQNGEIKQLAMRLKELLSNYGRVAKVKSRLDSVFEHYAHFETVLTLFSQAPCGGCRSSRPVCPVPCAAGDCHKEKGVDFCFQCEEYPCENPTFPVLKDRWRQKNDRMREIGVIEFYDEQSKSPRY